VWGIAIFLIPLVGVAAYWNDGGTQRTRVLRSLMLMVASGLACLALALVSWFVWIAPTGRGFLAWMWDASHGVAQHPSVMQFLRACFGSVRALITLGDLGYSVKAAILGGAAMTHWVDVLVPALAGLAVLSGMLLSIYGLLRQARRQPNGVAIRVGTIAAAAWLPSFLLAATIYGGTELHMVAGAAPFVALAVTQGFAEYPRRMAPVFIALLCVTNFGGSILPLAIRGGPLAARVGPAARAHMPAGSAVVFFGQDITHSEGQIPFYRDTIQIVNIGTDVADRGPDGWDERLDVALNTVAARGGQVAVLSDLLERPTPGGIKLDIAEFPRPSMADVRAFFDRWQEGPSFKVDRFTFVMLTPPPSSPP
jgi:hypothetical protein